MHLYRVSYPDANGVTVHEWVSSLSRAKTRMNKLAKSGAAPRHAIKTDYVGLAFGKTPLLRWLNVNANNPSMEKANG